MNQSNITVFFRYDDFSALSPFRVDRELALLFAQYRMCCSYAVIPLVTDGNYRDSTPRGSQTLDDSRRTFLAASVDDDSIDVVLHGLHHRSNGLGAPHSEFRGLSFESQCDKLQQGKRLLEDVIRKPITAFVPPWNTYDEATLRAMTACGIGCISASRFGPPTAHGDSVSFLPITADILDLKVAIARAKHSADREAVVGMLLHPYDFLESGDERGRLTLQDMEALLLWLSKQDGVDVSSLSAILDQCRDLSSSRFAANGPSSVEDLRPPCVPAVSDIPFYMGTVTATRKRRRRTVGTLATQLAGAILGALSGWGLAAIVPRSYAVASAIAWAIPCLLILLIAWRTKMLGKLFFRPALALFFGLGWALALIWLALIGHGRIGP